MMNVLTIIIVLGASALESVSYLGFVKNHLSVPAWIIYVTGISYLVARARKQPHRVIIGSLRLLAITAILAYVSLSWVEAFTYQNYIYSHVHINLAGFTYFTCLTCIITLLMGSSERNFKGLLRSSLKGVMVFFFVFNTSRLVPQVVQASRDIVRAPLASYDEKLASAYPGFYPAMKMIVNHSPDDATIYIPPQGSPWVTEGNRYLVMSFLYPRQVEHFTGIEAITNKKSYVLIAKGSWPTDGSNEYGWPKEKIGAERIWKFDITSQTSEEFMRNYDPTRDIWEWGLIEVKQ